ncbi:hypothetical protein BH10BAC2_BH10BAC2_09690 [soil metagenome]
MSNKKILCLYVIAPFLICLTSLSESCSSSKKTIQEDFEGVPLLLAWNEDTVNSYQVALTKNDRFYYTILKTNIDTEYYSGSYKGFDTIFLRFDKNLKPKGAESYLIRKVSGRYLIQNFTDGQKQIFFRIHSSSSRHGI